MISGRQVPFNLVSSDEANAALPVRWRVVQDVKDLEAVLIFLREFIEFSTEEDILNVDISVDEGNLRAIKRVFEGSTDDLEHGRNASAACNHTDLASERCMVPELALGSPDTNFIADLEQREEARDVALLIRLHEQN